MRDQVAARAATVLRPAGAFARLDAVAAWLAGWQGTTAPRVDRPHVVVFAADHGVAVDEVSAYPAEVTAAMDEAIRSGAATVSVLAREVGATLELVDVGVGWPTGNIRVADAMNGDDFDAAAAAGSAAANGDHDGLPCRGLRRSGACAGPGPDPAPVASPNTD